jgi:hypothetical protein
LLIWEVLEIASGKALYGITIILCLVRTMKNKYYLYKGFEKGMHILTPWSRVLLEKLKGTELHKKFCAFYGT